METTEEIVHIVKEKTTAYIVRDSKAVALINSNIESGSVIFFTYSTKPDNPLIGIISRDIKYLPTDQKIPETSEEAQYMICVVPKEDGRKK